MIDRKAAVMNTDYEVKTSDEIQDHEWDAFVARVPGGHHVQTSLWGQVKALLGWRVARVVVTRQGRIMAGAQLLIRPAPLVGAVAYLTKGPVCLAEDVGLAELVLDEICRLSRAHHVQLLAIQPPNNGQAMISLLSPRGFRPSSLELAPTATILIDVTPDLDDILAQMKRQTRQNIHRSERQGISVHEGTERDLDTFYDLYVATSQRQEFSVHPAEYYIRMWQVFAPHGYIKLLLAKHGAEAVSALLIMPFGNTVIAKRLGWSGHYADRRPNEAVFWSAIQWAKSQGYSFFDFEGIDPMRARAVLRGESLPESFHHSPDFFKLGFGGQVVLYPEAYDQVYNPILRWAHRKAAPRIGGKSVASRLMDSLRKR
ncbi:MAG: peptidoglycan bridge formation glycyltransferase FemA/FemB family protein [Chloroflexi bacterium]|nr:peptidoglycan bridge formation glycyltransferase FemA/FemB family protein [Chloroflexota bacterium]